MTEEFKLCIIIPCYNEEKRLDITRISLFLKSNKTTLLCFVNDGSKDKTLEVLHKIKADFPQNISAISTSKNVGKAEAVRTGVQHCNTSYQFTKIAYLDADLATTLEECVEISEQVNNNVVFAFGSRIAKIDSNIQRKFSRFLIGRVIATFISRQLKLPVYDTQCGCKIFEKELSKIIFKDKFISKWLFDVELFHRIISIYELNEMKNISKEIPLKSWIDSGDSKVELSYFFKLWIDLFQIKKYYR